MSKTRPRVYFSLRCCEATAVLVGAGRVEKLAERPELAVEVAKEISAARNQGILVIQTPAVTFFWPLAEGVA